jgi:hypothetical protein
MGPDWKLLTPHVPLEPETEIYVQPPSGGGQAIAEWILAGGSTVLVGGPAGIGKSTELARAAKLLQKERISCVVPVDRWENMRRISADQLLLRIAGRVAFLGIQLTLHLSSELKSALVHAGVLSVSVAGLPGVPYLSSPRVLLQQTLAEVIRLSYQGRVTLLIDGLERMPEGPDALEIFDALGTIPPEVEIVTVVPWHAMFGPRSETVVRPRERFEVLRAPEVEGESGVAGREFLLEILERRLSLSPAGPPPEVRPILVDAATWSAGMPRTFLQLMADAGTYARLRRDAPWPDPTDLADAVADQQDSFRRQLLPGDAAAIRGAAGTDGLELDLSRKVRLLANGILLERLRDRRPILEIHPLARSAVEKRASDA